MDRIREFVPAIVTIVITFVTVAFGYGRINQKVKDMEKENKELKERLNRIEDKNSEQHAKLFEVSSETKVMVGELKGYLMGKSKK